MYSSSTSDTVFPSTRFSLISRLLSTLAIMACCLPAYADDWAFELHASAKDVYAKKSMQVRCSDIPHLLSTKAEKSIYLAIRDAALFQDKDCKPIIQKHRAVLAKIPGLPDAMAFYDYRSGDTNGLRQLARSFDADARRTQDHWSVEIFGFIADWDTAGRRLVRHSAYSDGAGSELLCSALKWHRYLYGEVDFEKHWFSIGKQERVKHEVLQDMFDNCRP